MKLLEIGNKSFKKNRIHHKESFFRRFYKDGVNGAILFGLINYDIMIKYEKSIERIWNTFNFK